MAANNQSKQQWDPTLNAAMKGGQIAPNKNFEADLTKAEEALINAGNDINAKQAAVQDLQKELDAYLTNAKEKGIQIDQQQVKKYQNEIAEAKTGATDAVKNKKNLKTQNKAKGLDQTKNGGTAPGQNQQQQQGQEQK
jgi:hypothetical protein